MDPAQTRISPGGAVITLSVMLLLLAAPAGLSRAYAASPDIVWSAPGHSVPVQSVAFSPDGATVASSDTAGFVKLWRLPEGRLLRTLRTPKNARELAFSADGQILACGSTNAVRLWRVADGTLIREFSDLPDRTYVNTIALSPDGRRVAMGGVNLPLVVRDVEDGAVLLSIPGSLMATNALAFSPDGSLVAVGGTDRLLKLYRVENGELVQTLTGHRGAIESACFFPDGQSIASAGSNDRVRIWRVSDGALLRTMQGNPENYDTVAVGIHPQTGSPIVAAAGEDKVIYLWRASDGQLLKVLPGHIYPVRDLSFSPDGSTLVSASEDNTVRCWSVLQGTELRTLTSHRGQVLTTAFSPDGSVVASGCSDTFLRQWRTSDGAQALAPLEHPFAVSSVSYSPDGRLLAASTYDSPLRVWRYPEGDRLFWLRGHSGAVFAVAFAPDSRFLASTSGDGTVRIWSMETGLTERILAGHSSQVYAVSWSPDGALIATGGADGTVRLWLASTGDPVRILAGHAKAVNAVAFSPDGRTIASAGDDSAVRLWRAQDGTCLQTLQLPSTRLRSLAFSPDGVAVAAGGERIVREGLPPGSSQMLFGIVGVWRARDGALLAGWDEELGYSVASLAFSPDGSRLALARKDGVLLLVKAPSLVGPASSPGHAKVLDENTLLQMSGLVVSAAFPDFLYVQSPDRSSGIRVAVPGHTLETGTVVSITGQLKTTSDGERYIQADSIEAQGVAPVIPLEMTLKAVGGGDAGEPPSGQQGVTGGVGLNSIGLLVRVTGRVTAIAEDRSWLTLWDGSAVSDADGNRGVRCLAAGLVPPDLAAGEVVSVTGAISCRRSGTALHPVVLARIAEDILLR